MRNILIFLSLFLAGFVNAQSRLSPTFHRPGHFLNDQVYDPNRPLSAEILSNSVSFISPTKKLKDGNLSISWSPVYDTYYTLDTNNLVFELGGSYTISKIQIFESNPGTVVAISSGNNPYSLSPDTVINLNTNKVHEVPLHNKNVKFINLALTKGGAGPSEVRIFGQLVTADVLPPITLRPQKTFQDFVGWDCNEFTPDSTMPWGTDIRHYDFTDKIALDSLTYVFQPDRQGVYLDDYYKNAKDSGRTVFPLWNNAPDLYKNSYNGTGLTWDSEFKPMYYGANPYSPLAWKKEGETAFQLAARYGGSSILSSLLKINLSFASPYGNVKKSGLDYLDYYEFDNETDRWWKNDSNKFFLPLQAATLASVRYDGHQNTLGPGVGIKNADPTAKLVQAALADFNLDYIKLMYYASKKIRTDGIVPIDVWNYHWYINTGAGQYAENSVGAAPELATRLDVPGVGIQEILAQKCDWILRYMPGKEICYSESGYDCGPASYCGVPLLTQAQAAAAAFPQNSDDLQASLLIRSVIEVQSSRRIDNMILFETYDEINYKDVPDQYLDVRNNPEAWYSIYYGGSSFATSGIVKGQFAYILGNSSTAKTFGSSTGTVTLSLDPRRLHFSWPAGPTDTLDLIDESNYNNRFKCLIISQSHTSLVVNIIRSQGSGTLSQFVIQTPYAKKPSWYAFNNCFKTFGDCYLVADSSKSNYRDYVYRNLAGTKEVRVVWKPTVDGSQLNNVVLYYPNTNPVTQKQFLSRTGAINSVSVTGGHWTTNINEQPKIFFYSLTPYTNAFPTANAGADKGIITTSTTFTGSGVDTDGSIASYLWTKQSGPGATLSGTTTTTLLLSGLSVGTYVFRLTVTDNLGGTGYDEVTLTVSSSNNPPVAYNGSATITSPNVTFYADATDSDGTIASRLWSQVSGPNTPTFSSYTTYSVFISGLINGSYLFKCIVTDNGGAKDTSFFTCSVSGVSGGGSSNSAPTANAGSDQSIFVTTATLSGSGTDIDGSISSYAWTKQSGGTATLTGANTASLSLSGLAVGSYTFRLTVTDNLGATDFDDVTIVVNSSSGGSSASAYTDFDLVSAIGPGGVTIPTLVYLPVGYGSGAKFPVIVEAPGQGEKYDGSLTRTQNFNNVKNKVMLRYAGFGNNIPFVVIMPMITFAEFDSYDGSQSGPNYSPGLVTHELRQYAIDHYDGDPQRCHLSGLSLGGQTICNSAIAYPNDWATCTVIASYVQAYTLASPVRAVFNVIINKDDSQYLYGNPPYSHVAWVDQLNSLGNVGFPSTYTVFASGGHSGWNEVYDLTASSKTLWVNSSVPNNTPYFNPYTWMLKYKIVSGTVQLVSP